MCGITGYLSNNNPLSSQKLLEAVKILQHRGPEELNIWQSNDGNIGLGHTRLAIIDIVEGHQPLVSKDHTIRAVVNGEFYEYEKIRNDLIAKGYSFHTHSDSEILIALYQEYGTNCLSYLRGEFAFILYDDKQKIIFAARDRFGIKPLFYTQYNNGFYLASEIKSLLRYDISTRWHELGVLAMIQLVWPEEYTIFDNVYSLKPGHYLIASQKEIKLIKYWDMNFAKSDDIPQQYDEREYIRIFREKLEDAVRIRLKADVPIACYLSGGLDSATVLALASKIHNQPIKSFTIVFDNPLFDEVKIAREMAKHVGSELFEVRVTQKDLADHFSDSLWFTEYPLANAGIVAEYLLSKFVHEHHFKVVLTGEGSDELIAGYQLFKEDYINNSLQFSNKNEKEKLLKIIKHSAVASGILSATKEVEVIEDINNILGYIPTQFKTGTLRGREMYELYSDEFKNKSKLFDPIKHLIDKLDITQLTDRSTINKSLYIFNKTFLPGYILCMEGDRVQMANAIEGRLPYLDHPLFEFCSNLPDEMKIRGIKEKYILREAAKELLTKTIYERVKHPFMAPPVIDETDNYMYSYMQEVFNSDVLERMPFFNKSAVLQLLHRLPKMETKEMLAADSLLITILSLCCLQERFKISN